MKSLKKTNSKKSLFLALIILFCLSTFGYSQESYLTKSKSSLATLDDQVIHASNIITSGKTIVVFIESYNDEHASYIQELIIQKEKENFLKDTEIVAICYDNQGTFKHIKPIINKRKWNIDIYIDKDRTLFNYVNLEQPLLTLIFDGNTLVNQFYGNRVKVDSSFFGNRYGSVILN